MILIFHAQNRVHLFFLPPYNHMPSQDTIAGTNFPFPDAFAELPRAELPSEELPGEQSEECGDVTGSGRGPRGVGDNCLGKIDTWERNRQRTQSHENGTMIPLQTKNSNRVTRHDIPLSTAELTQI